MISVYQQFFRHLDLNFYVKWPIVSCSLGVDLQACKVWKILWERFRKESGWIFSSLRKQPTSHEVATCALAKRRLSNERRNSILMTRHYPDLGSTSDWLKRAGTSFQPIRSTTKIWVVTRHQYGISALVTQTSFYEGSSGDLAKCRLFSQAKFFPVKKLQIHVIFYCFIGTSVILTDWNNVFTSS